MTVTPRRVLSIDTYKDGSPWVSVEGTITRYPIDQVEIVERVACS